MAMKQELKTWSMIVVDVRYLNKSLPSNALPLVHAHPMVVFPEILS